MLNAHDVAGDVAAAGTALAGLMLVFMGGISSGYGSYTADQQGAVKTRFRIKIWFALAGFIASTISAGMALYGKAYDCTELIPSSVHLLLFAAFPIAALAALLSALEIN